MSDTTYYLVEVVVRVTNTEHHRIAGVVQGGRTPGYGHMLLRRPKDVEAAESRLNERFADRALLIWDTGDARDITVDKESLVYMVNYGPWEPA